MFTLVNTVVDMDSSLYEVIVTVMHPVTGSLSSLSKMFHLEVGMTSIIKFPPID